MGRKVRNILIEPKFQLKLMSYFVGLFILTTLTLYSTTYLFFWSLKAKALNVGLTEGHVFFMFLDNQKSQMDMLFVFLAICNFILLISAGFIVSHRVAGPIHKLKKYLSGLSPEDQDFTLRNKDFFKDMEPIINDLRKRLK